MTGMVSRYLLAAAALLLAVPNIAHAAWEWSDRTNMEDAECLAGTWSNQSWPKKDTAWVPNLCPSLGTVVAKIDRKDAADWTVWLRDDAQAQKSGTAGNVRGIHCCRDLSDLCNKSDVVNPEGCVEQFEASPASDATSEGESRSFLLRSCRDATATADPGSLSCMINTTCTWWKPAYQAYVKQQSNIQVTVPYLDVSRLTLSREGVLSVP